MHIVADPATAADILNNDLSKIHTWSKTWLVKFNPSKTESMFFSRKHSQPTHPILSINGVPINQVKVNKHLGLTFSDDSKLKFHKYLNALMRLGNAKGY